MATAFDLSDEPLLCQIIVIKVGPRGLPIVLPYVFRQTLFEFFVFNTCSLSIPTCIHILHVAVKAAELGQKLGLVQIALRSLNICLYTWTLVKAAISVEFGLV